MKKIIFLLLTGFAAFTAHSQVTFKPGLRAGVNFSRLTQTDFDTKTDFYIGGYGAIKMSRFYTLQPEINYSRQGSQGEIEYYDFNNEVFYTRDTDVSIQYLSFGLMNKFTFNDQINIHFGPTMDFETGSDVRTNSDVDLAFTAGIGYTLPFGLTIEARVKKGIVDVLETDDFNDSDSFVEDYNTNFVFQLGLAYSFDVTGTTK